MTLTINKSESLTATNVNILPSEEIKMAAGKYELYYGFKAETYLVYVTAFAGRLYGELVRSFEYFVEYEGTSLAPHTTLVKWKCYIKRITDSDWLVYQYRANNTNTVVLFVSDC